MKSHLSDICIHISDRSQFGCLPHCAPPNAGHYSPRRTQLAVVTFVIHARKHGRAKIGDVIRLSGVSRNMLKKHFRMLFQHGHLKRHGTGNGSWYALP
jgi:predicted transcriptional regulator